MTNTLPCFIWMPLWNLKLRELRGKLRHIKKVNELGKIGTKSFGTGGINQGWSFTPKTGLS